MYPEKLQFIETNGTYGFDRLLGTDTYRKNGIKARELLARHAPAVCEFAEKTMKYRIY